MERIIVGSSGWSKEDLKTDPEKLNKISRVRRYISVDRQYK